MTRKTPVRTRKVAILLTKSRRFAKLVRPRTYEETARAELERMS